MHGVTTSRRNGVISRSKHLSRAKSIHIIAFVALFLLTVVGGIGFSIFNALHVSTVADCVVTDKDRTAAQDGTSNMRVYTENCGTFTIADSLLDGNFSSADTYASIKAGNTYTFETRGLRIPIISSFPNITHIK